MENSTEKDANKLSSDKNTDTVIIGHTNNGKGRKFCGPFEENKENGAEDFFEIIWEGHPSGLFHQLLTKLHLNFVKYQISKDELIITTGFFVKKQKSIELYCLKDPDLTQNLYQQWLNIGTITVRVDAAHNSEKAGTILTLKDVKGADRVRKILRDAIEDDVMERKITYFDKI